MKTSNALKLISLAAVLALGGCQQSLERNDGVTTTAGNSLAVNQAITTVDPWPRNAENTDISGDGQRLGDTVTKYKTANTPEDDSGNANDLAAVFGQLAKGPK